MLDRLIDEEYKRLTGEQHKGAGGGNGKQGDRGGRNNDRPDIKPGDLIKMIDLRHKLSPPGASHDKFWRELEEIRKRSLPKDRPPRRTCKATERGERDSK
jgi:hypothetical protein